MLTLSITKRQIILLESILKKKINKSYLIIFFLIFSFSTSHANQKWIIDKNISRISFEVPVLFATNVKGDFKDIDGFVEIDLKNRTNNKAILSVSVASVDSNYKKYRKLLLGPLFFDILNYPIGLIDTKKFIYNDESELNINVELTIKGISKIVEAELKVKKLTSEIVQILGSLEFSRTDFNIGTGSWSNTSILRDNIIIDSNIFLIKE